MNISIHLMFLLIANMVSGKTGLCGISIHLMFLLIEKTNSYRLLEKHFNTSHVSINLMPGSHIQLQSGNFNTSHVSINRKKSPHLLMIIRHFNTSHVSINLVCVRVFEQSHIISIHLMFLLIIAAEWRESTEKHISIHLMFLLIGKEAWKMVKKPRFQYISCFY